MPLVPIMPISGEKRCILPPRPREQPVSRPKSSAINSRGGIPLAKAWPCPRCVEKIGSRSVRCAQTPVAIASWPTYVWHAP